jgi:hypothetical protein
MDHVSRTGAVPNAGLTGKMARRVVGGLLAGAMAIGSPMRSPALAQTHDHCASQGTSAATAPKEDDIMHAGPARE